MAVKAKCPSCDAELDIPDDPTLAALKESVDKLVAENAKLREKLETAGVKPPEPSAVPAAKKAAAKTPARFVTLFDYDEDDEDEEEER